MQDINADIILLFLYQNNEYVVSFGLSTLKLYEYDKDRKKFEQKKKKKCSEKCFSVDTTLKCVQF